MSKAFEIATGRHGREPICGDRPDTDLVCTLAPHGPEARHQDERYGTTWRRLALGWGAQ